MLRHDILFNLFIFPYTNKVKDRNPILAVKYKCNEGNCDFSEAMEQIQSNVDLESFASRDDINKIVIDIKNHQSDYIPAASDGFIITKMGFYLVSLENETKQGSVTGLVDLNDYKFRLLEESQKTAYRQEIRKDLEAYKIRNNCSII